MRQLFALAAGRLSLPGLCLSLAVPEVLRFIDFWASLRIATVLREQLAGWSGWYWGFIWLPTGIRIVSYMAEALQYVHRENPNTFREAAKSRAQLSCLAPFQFDGVYLAFLEGRRLFTSGPEKGYGVQLFCGRLIEASTKALPLAIIHTHLLLQDEVANRRGQHWGVQVAALAMSILACSGAFYKTATTLVPKLGKMSHSDRIWLFTYMASDVLLRIETVSIFLFVFQSGRRWYPAIVLCGYQLWVIRSISLEHDCSSLKSTTKGLLHFMILSLLTNGTTLVPIGFLVACRGLGPVDKTGRIKLGHEFRFKEDRLRRFMMYCLCQRYLLEPLTLLGYITLSPGAFHGVPVRMMLGIQSACCFSLCCFSLYKVRRAQTQPDPAVAAAEKRSALQRQRRVDPDPNCESKEEELAYRGIELGNLLFFYRHDLSSQMPHFDRDTSTTNEVVRQAIIPLSFEMGCLALASGTRKEKPYLLAERMVSHNWSNLFSHLVAAIVADALEVPIYGPILDRLCEDTFDGLWNELEEQDLLGISYWVCAFSVNQHTCICGTTLCPCEKPKYLNGDHRCEIDKFDTMMAFMIKERVRLQKTPVRHLIAVDEGFEIFRRAWVVSELVVAHGMGISQSVKVCSLACIEKNHDEGKIDIERCESSRPEDKVEILAKAQQKLGSIQEFNNTLNKLVFDPEGGLLGQCEHEIRKYQASWLPSLTAVMGTLVLLILLDRKLQ